MHTLKCFMGHDAMVAIFACTENERVRFPYVSTIMEKLNQLINSKFEEIHGLEIDIRLCSSYSKIKLYEKRISEIEEEISELQKQFSKLKSKKMRL